ncbi:MAG: GDP-mannose 4,6-dehydratase, partial [Chloroflexota bacterium]
MPYRGARFYDSKRVLVTGGLGFIGSNLAARLVDLGAQVLLIDPMISETGANRFNIAGIEDQVSTRLVDVRDALAIER